MILLESELILKPGKYRHYKGRTYELICVAKHTETDEPLVIYRALYGDRKIWARPYSMWTEKVMVNGVETPRFTWIDD